MSEFIKSALHWNQSQIHLNIVFYFYGLNVCQHKNTLKTILKPYETETLLCDFVIKRKMLKFIVSFFLLYFDASYFTLFSALFLSSLFMQKCLKIKFKTTIFLWRKKDDKSRSLYGYKYWSSLAFSYLTPMDLRY